MSDSIYSYNNENDTIMINGIILSLKSILSLNNVISQQEDEMKKRRIISAKEELDIIQKQKNLDNKYALTIESFFDDYYEEWSDDVKNGGKKPWITVKNKNSIRYLIVYDKIDVCTLICLD